MGKARRRSAPVVNEHDARELDLYAENTGEIYPQKQAIIKNLQRKIEAGKYNAKLAPKLWAYWYETAAKRYAREFSIGTDWSRMFPKALRDHLARGRAEHEYRRIRQGDYGSLGSA